MVSERAMGAVGGLEQLFTTNAAPVAIALSNMVVFSEELNKLASELRVTVATNQAGLSGALDNLESASATIKLMLNEVNMGKGLVGGLLKDEQMRLEMFQLVNNLTILSSNMSKYGLLYKPKKPKVSDEKNRFPYEGKGR
jgi:hypothetical protein